MMMTKVMTFVDSLHRAQLLILLPELSRMNEIV